MLYVKSKLHLLIIVSLSSVFATFTFKHVWYVFFPRDPKALSANPAMLGLNAISLAASDSLFFPVWLLCVHAVDDMKVLIWRGTVRIMVCL